VVPACLPVRRLRDGGGENLMSLGPLRACFITADPGHGNRTRGQLAVRAVQAMGLGRGQGLGLVRMVWSAQAIFRRHPMTGPDPPRHIEIRDGDHTIAAGEVMTCEEAARTARVWLHAAPGHVTPGKRASLVDAVMDLPEVQASARLEATVPLGDTELPEHLRQRTHDAVTRPAGCAARADADIPAQSRSGARRRNVRLLISAPVPARGLAWQLSPVRLWSGPAH
jgi:hypothetical protein